MRHSRPNYDNAVEKESKSLVIHRDKSKQECRDKPWKYRSMNLTIEMSNLTNNCERL